MSRKLKKRIKRVGAGAAVYLAVILLARLVPDINDDCDHRGFFCGRLS